MIPANYPETQRKCATIVCLVPISAAFDPSQPLPPFRPATGKNPLIPESGLIPGMMLFHLPTRKISGRPLPGRKRSCLAEASLTAVHAPVTAICAQAVYHGTVSNKCQKINISSTKNEKLLMHHGIILTPKKGRLMPQGGIVPWVFSTGKKRSFLKQYSRGTLILKDWMLRVSNTRFWRIGIIFTAGTLTILSGWRRQI